MKNDNKNGTIQSSDTDINSQKSLTPLYDTLREFAACEPLRMAMPGHKGKPLAGVEDYALIDFTELPPTGNLYESGGAIEEAERLWAKAWGADHCLFLTGGSTQGIHTALLCGGVPGGEILVDRVSHRSIHTGMALLDQRPKWLERPWLAEAGIVGPIEPEAVERGLRENPNINTVCITSPTYYGIISDVDTVAGICHRYGARLIVDAAHGAHLFLTGENPYTKADLVVTSSHKTLRAPGQSALLFANEPITMEAMREASMVFATSSPSYAMMAALDKCRAYYEAGGRAAYRETAEAVAALRRDYPSLTEDDGPMDPARFVLCVEDGFAVEEALQRLNIWPEMADKGHVVFILTDCDSPEEIQRLRDGLNHLKLNGKHRLKSQFPVPPEIPRTVLTPREAFFGRKVDLPFEAAAGRICAQQMAPYPPGVPVAAPGEEISKKILSYLREIGYNRTSVLCADVF